MFETLSRAKAGRAGIIAEVTLSIIDFETWSGKPEPGIVERESSLTCEARFVQQFLHRTPTPG
jgi:hypothetical protein